MSEKPTAVLWGNPSRLPLVYPKPVLDRLHAMVAIAGLSPDAEAAPSPAEPPDETRIVLGTWGLRRIDDPLLARLPNLEALFYGAGTIRGFVSDALWERGVPIVSSAYANAIPVVDYTVSVILLGLKRFWSSAIEYKQLRKRPPTSERGPGNYRAVVSLISFGQVARLVAERLKALGMHVLVYDPFLDEAAATSAGVEKVGLEEAFESGDVVSLHTPKLEETIGLIGQEHFGRMRPDTLFVNTSRGAVVREQEMIRFLEARPDVQAVLDVTHPEPPEPESPLYDLPNVVLTPHIAGSLGRECERMGALVADELERFLRGEPLRHAVTREQARLQA